MLIWAGGPVDESRVKTPPVEPSLVDPVERDARESEEWFLRLPEAVQEQTRRSWLERARSESVDLRVVRANVWRAAWESGLLLALCALFVNIFTGTLGVFLLLLGVGFVVGAVIGVAAVTLRCGRFRLCVLGALGFLGVQLVVAGPRPEMLDIIVTLFGLYLVANVFGVYGVRREFRGMVGEG